MYKELCNGPSKIAQEIVENGNSYVFVLLENVANFSPHTPDTHQVLTYAYNTKEAQNYLPVNNVISMATKTASFCRSKMSFHPLFPMLLSLKSVALKK